MEPGWAVLISVAVGALIGGMTNLLAIVMLFRPHRPWNVGRWTLPFTPGLIPKRQRELARQLGHVVEEHLLSAESVSGFIEETLSPGWLHRRVMDGLKRIGRSDETVAQWLAAVGWTKSGVRDTEGKRTAWFDRLLMLLQPWTSDVGSRTPAQWLGEEGVQEIRSRIPALAHWLWLRANEAYGKDESRRLVYRWVHDFLHTRLRGGRMWQTVAAFFVDETKVAAWLYRQVADWLARPETREQLARWLQEQWDVYAHRPLDAWFKGWAEERPFLQQMAARLVQSWWDELLDKPLRDVLAPLQEEPWRETLTIGLAAVEEELIRRLPALLRRLPMAQVVERQVISYPLPELEKLIVQVTRRELKMITLLGALIGGLVGLVQGTWMVVFFA